jgi:16S rRNA processing protein RimM
MSSSIGEVGDSTDTGQRDEWVELGKINGVFGVAGWVKVFSFTRPREAILDYPTWYIHRPHTQPTIAMERKVLHGRLQGAGVVARLAGCDTRDAAQELMGASISVPSTALSELETGEYYWRDLIGLEVVNRAGESFGRVDELLETGANDVLVVGGEDGCLVPFTREVICDVDLAKGRILVDWERDF